MRKLFKKSLACVLAVALCLTAMVGVLTVSADTLDGTIEIADVTIEAGSTTATIPVTFTVTGDEADLINTGYINYEIDGATVTRVYDSVGNLGTNTAGSMFEIWLDETGEGGAKVANANIVVEFAAETESFTLKLSNNTSATNTEKLIDFGTAEKTFTVKAAHVHNFVPTVTKDATCEEDGVKTFACECGKDTYTEAIPAIGHKWDEGKETTAPDCDNAGVMTYTCLNDGNHTKTEAIDALGHDMKPVDAVPATCTTPGKTAGTKCSRCDATEGIEDVDALGHNYGDNLEYCANNCGTANPDYVAPGPVVVAAPEQLTHAVAIGDTFGVIFKFRESSISDEYASYRLDLKRTVNAGGFNFGYDTTSVTNFNDGGDDLIMAPTWYGFELFSLSAPIELTWHFFDKNGVEVAYSEPETTSLADIAVAYHDSNESGANMKKVMADMIQVGAAALNHFTANRTKKCDYSTLPVPTIDSPYTTTELGAFAEYNSAEGLSVKVAGALSTSAYFNMSFAENVANREQYRFEVTYYNAMKRREITESIAGSTMKGDETTCMASLTNFPLFATNADVTFKLYKEGIEAPIAVNHYCMEQYYAAGLASNSGSATLKTLMRELGEMAQSIRKARNL